MEIPLLEISCRTHSCMNSNPCSAAITTFRPWHSSSTISLTFIASLPLLSDSCCARLLPAMRNRNSEIAKPNHRGRAYPTRQQSRVAFAPRSLAQRTYQDCGLVLASRSLPHLLSNHHHQPNLTRQQDGKCTCLCVPQSPTSWPRFRSWPA